MSSQKIEITYTSILRVVVMLAVVYFLFLIRDILALLFVSLVFATAVGPWVSWFEKRNVPRALGIVIIYVLLIGIVSLLVVLMIPPLTEQLNQLARNFPQFFQRLMMSFTELQSGSSGGQVAETVQDSLASLQRGLTEATKGIFTTLSGIFGGVISFVAVLVLTFYMVVDEEGIKRVVKVITPKRKQQYIMDFAERIEKKLGRWLRGQLILMLAVGLLTYIGLLLLKVKYALVLALLAGLLEVIPYIGPLLSAVPAVLVAFTSSPLTALFVVILYFLVQQIENHALVPKIMEKAVGLNPIVVIASILIGGKLGGIVGAVIAVPVATAIALFLSDTFEISATEEIVPKNK